MKSRKWPPQVWRSSRPMREVVSRFKSPRLNSILQRISVNSFYFRSNYIISVLTSAILSIPFASSVFWFIMWIMILFVFSEIFIAPPVRLRLKGVDENSISACLVAFAIILYIFGLYINTIFECMSCLFSCIPSIMLFRILKINTLHTHTHTGFSVLALLVVAIHAIFTPRTTSSVSYAQIYMKKDILGDRSTDRNDNDEDYISGDDDDDVRVTKADRATRMNAFEQRYDALKGRYRFPNTARNSTTHNRFN